MNRVYAFFVFLFGLFCLAGGIIGFAKVGSAASMFAGVASAAALLPCGIGISRGVRFPVWIVMAASLLLGGRFLMGYIKVHQVMPHLIMVVLSGACLVLSIIHLATRPRVVKKAN